MPPQPSSSSRSGNRRGSRRGYDPEDRMRRALEAQAAAALAARQVLDKAAARRDAEWRSAADGNVRRVRVVVSAPFALGVIVAALGFLSPALFAVGAVLIIGWAVTAWLTWKAAATGSWLIVDGLTPDEAIDRGVVPALAGERYEDVTESLCAALGLDVPQLKVLVDPMPNAVSAGGMGAPATLVLTSGLLAIVDRIELEAVLAHELAHVKRLDTFSGGAAAALLHGGTMPLPGAARLATWLTGPERELEADMAALSATRYPPGLEQALAKIEASAAAVGSVEPRSLGSGARRDSSAMWIAPFGGPAAGSGGEGASSASSAPAGVFDLGARLDLLREL